MDPSDELSPVQIQAAHLIVTGTPFAVIAGELNISRLTLWRWRKLPAFRQYLGSLCSEADSALRHRIQSMTGAALDVLLQAMGDPTSPWACRLNAAAIVFRLADRWPPPIDQQGSGLWNGALQPETIQRIRSEVYGILPDLLPEQDPVEIEGSEATD